MNPAHTRTGHRIQAAHRDALPDLAQLMANAFQNDPISSWLFPDPHERSHRHPRFFAAFLDHAHRRGVVHVADRDDTARQDRTGVALWLDVQPDQPDQQDADDGLESALAVTLGPHQDRWHTLTTAMRAVHPTHRSHAYLTFLAAHPPGHGAGTGLLTRHLAHLDATGRAAYLEASSPRSATLYTRHGFRPLPHTIDLPDGPSLAPMWRDPQPGTREGTPEPAPA